MHREDVGPPLLCLVPPRLEDQFFMLQTQAPGELHSNTVLATVSEPRNADISRNVHWHADRERCGCYLEVEGRLAKQHQADRLILHT